MSKRKYFHDFEYKDRLIKLCLLADGEGETATVRAGYAVRLPEDYPEGEDAEKESEKIGKKISLGRAEKTPFVYLAVPSRYAFRGDFLKTVAKAEEIRIKKGEVEIKGIKNG